MTPAKNAERAEPRPGACLRVRECGSEKATGKGQSQGKGMAQGAECSHSPGP